MNEIRLASNITENQMPVYFVTNDANNIIIMASLNASDINRISKRCNGI
jgi:hypothetical protein